MNSSSVMPSAVADPVSSDFLALASHLSACDRTRDRRFRLRVWLDDLHGVAAPRIVSVGTGFVALALTLSWLVA